MDIGAITYSYRSMPFGPCNALKYALESGVKAIEFMGYDLECDAGSPADRLPWELDEATRAAADTWRKTVPVAAFEDVRARYHDAGIDIHIVKFGDIGTGDSEAEIDYCFKVAAALGARAITREVPRPDDRIAVGKRLAPFTDRYGIRVGFHNHTQINAQTYDGPLLDQGDKLGINFDIGHYTAANDDDPLALIRKFHDRIVSVHLKDRTTKAHGAQNLAFGKGDTPLAGLVALTRREGYTFPCDIELEYDIPDGSDAVKEVKRCLDYMQAL